MKCGKKEFEEDIWEWETPNFEIKLCLDCAIDAEFILENWIEEKKCQTKK